MVQASTAGSIADPKLPDVQVALVDTSRGCLFQGSEWSGFTHDHVLFADGADVNTQTKSSRSGSRFTASRANEAVQRSRQGPTSRNRLCRVSARSLPASGTARTFPCHSYRA